jgi:hypothetical protein
MDIMYVTGDGVVKEEKMVLNPYNNTDSEKK